MKNVIYLPADSKNLISMHRWGKDRKDDPFVGTRTDFSIFKWDNDSRVKNISHPATCPIPLMRVNEEQKDTYDAFCSKFFSEPEDICMLAGGPSPEILPPEIEKNPAAAQQPASSPLLFPSGIPVKWCGDKGTRICTVLDDNNDKCKVRVLGTDNILTLPKSSLTPLSSPDPAVIPTTPGDIDMEELNRCVTHEDLDRLWTGSSDDTQTELDRLCLYWHHRLDHCPLQTIHRLAERGILPKILLNVKKKPICAACIFAQAHKRGLSGRGPLRPIRKETQEPGEVTSADHIISQQPGLMPQVTGEISNKRYGGQS